MDRFTSLRRATAAWPWLAVLALSFWLAGPLWNASGVAFGSLVGDNVETPWFYDQVARALLAGDGWAGLTDFNHPAPVPRITDFPSVVDAILLAPLAWVLDWPQQYGAAQATVIGVNALGLAWLARALGCRGVAILLAGALGACCPPVWRELWLGRMNAAWPGLGAAALGAWLALFELPAERRTQVLRGGVAALLGALAVAIYPPLPALLIPAGLAFGWQKSSGLRSWILPLMAVGVGGLLAGPTLLEMQLSPKATMPVCASGDWMGMCEAGSAASAAHIGSPFIYELGFPLAGWGLLQTPSPGALPLNEGIPLGAWVLGLLALAHPRLGLSAGWVLAWTAVLALLAMGPCPGFTDHNQWDLRAVPGIGGLVDWAWCAVGVLHDFGRLNTAAVVLAAALSAVGVEAVRLRIPRIGGVLAAGLALGAGGHALGMAQGRLEDPQFWAPIPTLDSASLVAEFKTGPVAELPFDRHGQFLSVLEHPQLKRVNPFNPTDPPPDRLEFHAWLYALGQGEVLEPTPSNASARQSGIGWILFDPSRCDLPFTAKARACASEIPRALHQLLGPPTREAGAVKAWKVSVTETNPPSREQLE